MESLGPELPTPFIAVEGVENFRGLGFQALASSPGNAVSVRQGFIFRSATISYITAEGARKLTQDLGIKVIYDMRAAAEVLEAEKDILPVDIPGTERRLLPVATPGEGKFAPQDIVRLYQGKRLKDIYLDLISQLAQPLRIILEHIRDRPQDPFLVHCTAGKDRTGLTCALILCIAGCSQDYASFEYNLTEMGLKDFQAKMRSELLNAPDISLDEELLEDLVGARVETMKMTLEALSHKHGSIENFVMAETGLREEDLVCIRENLRPKI